ncbi:MAG: PDZ domain-containing protein, partial [Tepidisphaeraceae bacterium]
VLVGSGGLGAVGSLVFNGDGKAVGFVNVQQDQSAFLNFLKSPLATVTEPPRLFVPSRDFLQSFTDPPVEGKPLVLPWTGLGQLSGLRKDVAEFFGLTNQAAVEITDVIPGAAAAKAGLKRGQVVTKINGKPLERGDEPDELPQIVQRQILRMNVGEPITFTVIDRPGQPARDVTFPLLEQPKRANVARRYWAEDLGFGVREIVFADTYFKKLSPDQKGVLISLIKPNGAAANAQLRGSDVVTEINGQAVADIEQFKTLYEESRKLKAAEAMKLLVLRDGNTQVIRIEPPQ